MTDKATADNTKGTRTFPVAAAAGAGKGMVMSDTKGTTARGWTSEKWSLEAGRTIQTPSGEFYLTYGKEERSGNPLFRDFCKLDRIAHAVAELPQMVALLHRIADGWIETRYCGDDVAKRTESACDEARALLARIEEN